MKARKDELAQGHDYLELRIGDNWETGERVVKEHGERVVKEEREGSESPLPEGYVE